MVELTQLAVFFVNGASFGLSGALSPGPMQSLLISRTLDKGFWRAAPAAFAPVFTDVPIYLLMTTLIAQMPKEFRDLLQLLGGLLALLISVSGLSGLFSSKKKETTKKGPYIFYGLILGPMISIKVHKYQSQLVAAAYMAGVIITLIATQLSMMFVVHGSRKLLFAEGNDSKGLWAIKVFLSLMMGFFGLSSIMASLPFITTVFCSVTSMCVHQPKPVKMSVFENIAYTEAEARASHEDMIKYLDEISDWNVWGMKQRWTLEEELDVIAGLKTQDVRIRIEETGDDSTNKLNLYGNVRYGNNPKLIPVYKKQLEEVDAETDRERAELLHLRLGREQLTDGFLDEAVGHFKLLCYEWNAPKTCMDSDATTRYDGVLRDLLGITYMRIGETANCIENHNYDSCLLPIQGYGVHQHTDGSENSILYSLKSLEINPDDLGNRWLYNVAEMTLGRWNTPDMVEPKHMIPAHVFASSNDIGRFHDISSQVKVGIRGLAGGSVMADFNRDGFLDLMNSGSSARDQLGYSKNNGDGTFKDAVDEAGLRGFYNGINMAVTDYNNDGYPDPVVIRGGWHFDWWNLPNSLLRNNGDGTFTDVTKASGLWSEYACHSADWADFDNDGFLDVYFTNEINEDGWKHPPPFSSQPCQLFHNNGDGTFTDIGAASGVAECGWAKSGSWGDYNNDGRPDLYLVNYDGPVESVGYNVLFRNDGPKEVDENGKVLAWKFTDVSKEAGISGPKYGFTSWFFDWNNDGWEDILTVGFSTVDTWKVLDVLLNVTNFEHDGDRTTLYQNNKDGTFTDVSAQMNFSTVLNVMGANYGDFDNDGWLDIMFGTGAPDMRTLMPNAAYRNAEGKKFEDITSSTNMGHLQKGHGVAFGDIDNDGDQDVLVSLGAMYTDDDFTDALYLNPGQGNHWISILLTGVTTNRMGFGVRITVTVKSPSFPGKIRKIYHRNSVGGTFGTSTPHADIGLGDADGILSLEIHWPTSGTTQMFEFVPLDKIISVVEFDKDFEILDLPMVDFNPVVARMEEMQEMGMGEGCGCHDE